jgi:dipeptidyl aminopeptidase/acylaminoacyl peptidase
MHFVNFVPRIRVPTLLLHGRNDAGYPVDTFRTPSFDYSAVLRKK